MKIVPLSPAQQAEVKTLQDQFKTAQAAHVAAYKALLAYLQPISGAQAEPGRKTKLAVSDDGQHIIIG